MFFAKKSYWNPYKDIREIKRKWLILTEKIDISKSIQDQKSRDFFKQIFQKNYILIIFLKTLKLRQQRNNFLVKFLYKTYLV